MKEQLDDSAYGRAESIDTKVLRLVQRAMYVKQQAGAKTNSKTNKQFDDWAAVKVDEKRAIYGQAFKLT